MRSFPSKAQKGFTLIEVSLAIVIGVIVLAGAITLYNQSKISAGNSKAQEKALALAGLVEQLAAANNMQYPGLGAVDTGWRARREDAMASPWGGALTGSTAVRYAGGGTTNAAITWGTAVTGPFTTLVAASAGAAVYASGAGSTTVYDVGVVATKSYNNFFVGIMNPAAEGPAFTAGGK